MNERRGIIHTAMLLALGESPQLTSWARDEWAAQSWIDSAHDFLREQGMEGGTNRRKIIDDFVIWLGEMDSIRIMRELCEQEDRYHGAAEEHEPATD